MRTVLKLFTICLMVLGLCNSNVYAASTNLTWDDNTETDLAGYKIYRGNGACAVGPLQPLMINGTHATVLAPENAYADNTVPVFDGELCYEVTAYDTAGNESVRSNRATKTVNLIPPMAPVGVTIGTVTP